jgi:hypothetical protein
MECNPNCSLFPESTRSAIEERIRAAIPSTIQTTLGALIFQALIACTFAGACCAIWTPITVKNMSVLTLRLTFVSQFIRLTSIQLRKICKAEWLHIISHMFFHCRRTFIIVHKRNELWVYILFNHAEQLGWLISKAIMLVEDCLKLFVFVLTCDQFEQYLDISDWAACLDIRAG